MLRRPRQAKNLSWYVKRLSAMEPREVTRRLIDHWREMEWWQPYLAKAIDAKEAAARLAAKPSWYWRRLTAMGPDEIARRLSDRVQEAQWRLRFFAKNERPVTPATERPFVGGVSRERARDAPKGPREELLLAADRLLAGEWPTFAITRRDVTENVDWHLDPKTQSRAPADTYSFDIPFVGGASRFDTKYVWELSRHHQTTLLATAFWLTGEDRYARAAAGHIQSWIRSNPFLTGIHWASGIELGMRLIAFAWTRRLLAEWPEAAAHFEDNEAFAHCVVQHQWLLAHR